ncbi:MAG: phosphatase PAP2 family protein [Persicimonas sp.]
MRWQQVWLSNEGLEVCKRRAQTLTYIALVVAVCLGWPDQARGQAEPTGEHESSGDLAPGEVGSEEPVPIMDNFTVGELAAIGAFTATAALIGYFGEHIVGFPGKSFGPPARDSLDWEVSTGINPNPDLTDPFMGGVPDRIAEPFLVVGAGAYYGFGAVGSWLSEADWIWDTRHEFLAFSGAIATAEVFIQALKFSFGRDRPRMVRGCDPPADPCGEFGIPPERNVESNRQDGLSFPGGHTGASAAAMSFIYLDLSDHLVHHTLSDSSPTTRFWLGRILPLVPTYGFVALSFYERLHAQEHWLSDQAVGTVAGLAAGNAFYLVHFDDTGDPLRDNRDADDAGVAERGRLMPVVMSDGELGMGWGFAW